MAKITAQDVNKLRKQTGAGMMDCKKALVEADGDFEKAIEVLRKKGQKLSAKRADRDAKEGAVIAKVSGDRKRGVIVRLSSETDFVAKNEDFVAFADSIAALALEHFPANKEELLALTMTDHNMTVGEKVTEQVGVIGEKIEVADYRRLEAEQVAVYIHMGNKAAVLVGMNHAHDDFDEVGRDVAMQVAAMKPVALDKDFVDQATIDKELEIGREQARAEGKPDHILDRIAQGKLNKFFAENTLLNQTFVKNNKQTVRDYLKSKQKDLTIVDFQHVTLG